MSLRQSGVAGNLLRRAVRQRLQVRAFHRTHNARARASRQDGMRRELAVDRSAPMRAIQRGANVDGIAKRLFDR